LLFKRAKGFSLFWLGLEDFTNWKGRVLKLTSQKRLKKEERFWGLLGI